MVDATHSTAPVGSDTGVRKFTLSCSRCRASKLKCDRKEPCVSGHFFRAQANFFEDEGSFFFLVTDGVRQA
jgi:hypothetical protein